MLKLILKSKIEEIKENSPPKDAVFTSEIGFIFTSRD